MQEASAANAGDAVYRIAHDDDGGASWKPHYLSPPLSTHTLSLPISLLGSQRQLEGRDLASLYYGQAVLS